MLQLFNGPYCLNTKSSCLFAIIKVAELPTNVCTYTHEHTHTEKLVYLHTYMNNVLGCDEASPANAIMKCCSYIYLHKYLECTFTHVCVCVCFFTRLFICGCLCVLAVIAVVLLFAFWFNLIVYLHCAQHRIWRKTVWYIDIFRTPYILTICWNIYTVIPPTTVSINLYKNNFCQLY